MTRPVLLAAFGAVAALIVAGYVSPPVALALGLAFGLGPGDPCPRVTRTSRLVLQASVVCLGFGMNLFSLWEAGKIGLEFTIVTILATMALGWWLGRILKIEADTSLLVSAGTSICGGSAIAAVGSVLEADARSMSVALCTVFCLNAVALFVFPLLGHLLGLDQREFGLWAAIAIHDTSSVVGAAAKYGDEALVIATAVKLVRALWILPLALGVALVKRRRAAVLGFPWFILFFVLAAATTTFFPEHDAVYRLIKRAAVAGLTLALFFIGAELSRRALKSVGARPMIQGVLLWIVVAVAGLIAVRMLGRP